MLRLTRSLLVVATAFSVAANVTAFGGSNEDAQNGTRVEFRNDLIPVLTKNGCNAGACHGAAIGRGDFKLSLYGGDPSADYDAIVRETNGRRVNLSKPAESLIFLKPAEYVSHGGGTVFDDDSDSAKLILEWIKQGAMFDSKGEFVRIELTPRQHVVETLGEPIALKAVAHYSDGRSRDVTRWTIFTAEDSAAVDVDATSAVTRVLRRGRHIIVARYLSAVVPIEFIAPLTDAPVDLANETSQNFVDSEVLSSLETLRLRPSGDVDDSTFLRRVCLDLTGRLPSIERVTAFRASPRKDKRSRLVTELLASAEFTEYWTYQLAVLFRLRPPRDDARAAEVYHAWIAEQLKEETSYKEMAVQLITALGDSHENGPVGFYRTVNTPREQAEFMSELFMGSRLRCANCHNHPLDRWTQDDYHGLAAVFAKVERGRVVTDKPNGKVIHPRTLEPAVPRIPGERDLDGQTANVRRELVDWLTDRENPYFTRAIVNRLWKHMMGRGLVEPVDDFRATNPPTHPALLERLAEDFADNGYRLRHTLKVIATSSAYARSSNATEANRGDDRFYSHGTRRPLQPEVLADAISDVLGVASKYGEEPDGTRAIALIDPETRSRTLDVLGRCGREESCEASVQLAGGLAQKLHLFNGELLNERLAAKESRLRRLQDAGRSDIEIVTTFYLAALSRTPKESELRHWRNELKQLSSSDERRAFLEDFVWGLLTCREFVTNH